MYPMIFKYELDRNITEQWIELGENAVILSTGEQDGKPHVWALIHPEDTPRKHKFIVLGTGDPIPHNGLPGCFLGTVILDNGSYVIHIFCDDMWQNWTWRRASLLAREDSGR